jgi:hypothetical protein
MAIRFSQPQRRFEFFVALALTATSVLMVVIHAVHAGGLWRDEAGAVQVALMPSVHDLTEVFQHEAFPLLFPLTVRAYATVAGTGDAAFRVFGLLVGLASIAVLWTTTRTITGTVPLLSMALLGLSPAMLVWVGSIRGYGMGTVLMLITLSLIWRVVTAPNWWTIGLTAMAAICSVQTLYYNATLLFAVIIAGAIVTARKGNWKRVLLLLGIGAMAAATLIPYVFVLRNADWTKVIALPYFPFSLFKTKLFGTLAWGAPDLGWVWLLSAAGGIGAAAAAQVRRPSPPENGTRDASLYCLTALLVALPACFVFLKILRYPPREWYYVALMGLMAVALEGGLAAVPWPWWKNWGRAALAGVIGLVSFMPAWQMAHLRQTNIDLISAQLEQRATAGDVIVVAPWYYGVSFDRYYKGTVAWMTLPQITDHKMHRYDLVKERMTATSPIEPVLKAMAEALASGHHVWIVGWLSWLQPGQSPPQLAPAPYDPVGWDESAYNEVWSAQAAYSLQTTGGASAETIPLSSKQPINPYERPQLVLVRTRLNP